MDDDASLWVHSSPVTSWFDRQKAQDRLRSSVPAPVTLQMTDAHSLTFTGKRDETIPISMARPLQTLLMAHASLTATQTYNPDERPFLLTRAGCPGIQRYAQTWSGDNGTSWHTLRYNIPMGLGSGLSGLPNTGHDVGGFFGPAPEPELFIRWVQNALPYYACCAIRG